jgi:branched-subunit amino acid ABC-type transport system permease component
MTKWGIPLTSTLQHPQGSSLTGINIKLKQKRL